MLKHIPDILSPELLKALQEMGHGDRLCIGDGNFPGSSIAKSSGAALIDLSGHGICEILEAILKFVPLDDFVETPVLLMQNPPEEACPIHESYKNIISRYDDRGEGVIGKAERFAFYEQAEKCYAILLTGEKATWANVILQKGVVVHEKDGRMD